MYELPSLDDLMCPQVSAPLTERTVSVIAATAQRKKIYAAAYCRVSTQHEDQKSSIKIQQEHFLSQAGLHSDWIFVGLYTDIVSGTKKEKRPGLMRLLRDCSDGKVNLIMTKSISRFARNATDLLQMVRSLTAIGVGIIFEREKIDTRTMDSEFLLTVLASLAEDESHSISSNCRWAIQKRFKDGSYKMTTPPYGYDIVNGALVVNETEASVVREIFSRCIAGDGFTTIAHDLNLRGIATKRAGERRRDGRNASGKWNAKTIGCIIHNEAYVGDFLFQKTFKDGQFITRRNRGEYAQYYAEDHHEPLISRTDFEKAQHCVDLRTKAPKSSGKAYPLTKRLNCGCCGANLIHEVSKRKYPVWVCRRHRHSAKDCQMPVIPEPTLQSAFELAMGEEKKAVEYRKKAQTSEAGGGAESVIQQELAGIENARRNGKMTVKDYLTRKYQLQSELGSIHKAEDPKIEELLHAMRSGSSSFEDFERLVESVTVWSRSSFDFHFKCGLTVHVEMGTSQAEAM